MTERELRHLLRDQISMFGAIQRSPVEPEVRGGSVARIAGVVDPERPQERSGLELTPHPDGADRNGLDLEFQPAEDGSGHHMDGFAQEDDLAAEEARDGVKTAPDGEEKLVTLCLGDKEHRLPKETAEEVLRYVRRSEAQLRTLTNECRGLVEKAKQQPSTHEYVALRVELDETRKRLDGWERNYKEGRVVDSTEVVNATAVLKDLLEAREAELANVKGKLTNRGSAGDGQAVGGVDPVSLKALYAGASVTDGSVPAGGARVPGMLRLPPGTDISPRPPQMSYRPTMSPSDLLKRVGVFEGRNLKERPFAEWLEDFERVAHVSDWDDAMRCQEFPFQLKGEASRRYHKLPETVRHDWNALRKQMICFYPSIKPSSTMFRQLFKNRRQRKGESVECLAADLTDLAYDAYPDMTPRAREAEVMDQFRIAIWDDRIRHSLITLDDDGLTLERLMVRAKRFERVLDEEKTRLEGTSRGGRGAARPVRAFTAWDEEDDGTSEVAPEEPEAGPEEEGYPAYKEQRRVQKAVATGPGPAKKEPVTDPDQELQIWMKRMEEIIQKFEAFMTESKVIPGPPRPDPSRDLRCFECQGPHLRRNCQKYHHRMDLEAAEVRRKNAAAAPQGQQASGTSAQKGNWAKGVLTTPDSVLDRFSDWDNVRADSARKGTKTPKEDGKRSRRGRRRGATARNQDTNEKALSDLFVRYRGFTAADCDGELAGLIKEMRYKKDFYAAQPNAVVVPAKVGDVDVSAFLDTGATMSCVSEDLFHVLHDRGLAKRRDTELHDRGLAKRRDTDVKVNGLATKKAVRFNGECDLEFTIQGRPCTGRFYILPKVPYNLLVGYDILRENGCSVDCVSGGGLRAAWGSVASLCRDDIARITHDLYGQYGGKGAKRAYEGPQGF
jgi:hypothetical protein